MKTKRLLKSSSMSKIAPSKFSKITTPSESNKTLIKVSPNTDFEPRNIQVHIRIRPLVSSELKYSKKRIFNTYNNKSLQCFTSKKQYNFDYIYNEDSNQEMIFHNSIEPNLEKCLNGYNFCVFAYGQTGSGKTYSMGTNYCHENKCFQEIGIIPRSIIYLFNKKTELMKEYQILIKISYIELYNEEINDLIYSNNPSKSIVLQEDTNGEVKLSGVNESLVEEVDTALNILWTGNQNRKMASNNINEISSRSHSIFTVFVEKINRTTHEKLNFKINFVDLAGSERLKKSGATGDRFKESIFINSGLLALSKVIISLGKKEKNNLIASHIPFRDSKLTRMLKDSLLGNSITLMIACISPSELNFEETINTLNYSTFARIVKVKPRLNSLLNLQNNSDILIKKKKNFMDSIERVNRVRSLFIDSPTRYNFNKNESEEQKLKLEAIEMGLEDLKDDTLLLDDNFVNMNCLKSFKKDIYQGKKIQVDELKNEIEDNQINFMKQFSSHHSIKKAKNEEENTIIKITKNHKQFLNKTVDQKRIFNSSLEENESGSFESQIRNFDNCIYDKHEPVGIASFKPINRQTFSKKNLQYLINSLENTIMKKFETKASLKTTSEEKISFIDLMKSYQNKIESKINLLSEIKLHYEKTLKIIDSPKTKVQFEEKIDSINEELKMLKNRESKLKKMRENGIEEIEINETFYTQELKEIDLKIEEIKLNILNGKIRKDNSESVKISSSTCDTSKLSSSNLAEIMNLNQEIINLKSQNSEKEEQINQLIIENLTQKSKIYEIEKQIAEKANYYQEKIAFLVSQLKFLNSQYESKTPKSGQSEKKIQRQLSSRSLNHVDETQDKINRLVKNDLIEKIETCKNRKNTSVKFSKILNKSSIKSPKKEENLNDKTLSSKQKKSFIID